METPEESTKDASTNSRKDRLRKELDSLRREMEIAEFVTETGQRRRVAPKKTQLIRTKKRKLLEKDDAQQHAITVEEEEGTRRRLRGAKAALEDSVIQASLLFGGEEEAMEETDDGKSDIDVLESVDEDEIDTDEGRGRYEMYEDGEPLVDGDVEGVEEKEAPDGNETASAIRTNNVRFRDESVAATASGKVEEGKIPKSGKKRRRIMHRLRSFKSQRMAQRHGEALGAHAQGQPKVAIEKLKEVASDAPAAAQIYSSLGLVYEDMLKESSGKNRELDEEGDDDDEQDETDVEDESIKQKLNIAKKAYGSYHVAALLCKKDFTLWVRAGDTAMQIADLYTEAMASSNPSVNAIEDYRRDKKKWIEDAKKDFTSADNLKPPGIDVPAKLAVCHMELGNLSEAITILTDLKNRRLSAAETSYRIWLLYAELMLRIGHECTQWNRGIEKNKNYMFRRWLRKYSENFDWQERRLQALCLALEAAAGTKSCSHFIEWTKSRAKSSESSGTSITADDRWHTDSNKTPATAAAATSTSESNNRDSLDGNNVEVDEQRSDSETATDSVDVEPEIDPKTDAVDGIDTGNSQEDSDSSRLGDTASPSNVEEEVSTILGTSNNPLQNSVLSLRETFEKEKQHLLLENKTNLAKFDAATKEMELEPGSDAEKSRLAARETLVKAQRASVVKFVGDFHQRQAPTVTEDHGQGVPVQSHNTTAQLPISASCATVCNIASELIKHCLGLELYDGGRLVGEAVSLYLKERALMHQERLTAQDAFAKRQQSTDEAVLLHFEPYDDIEDEGNGSDDEQSVTAYLSDDDEISAVDGRLLESLKIGSLPPELRVLYGFSLIGEGGRDYVASNSVSSLSDLEQESQSLLREDAVDTNVVADPTWQLFRHAMVEPLQRTAAFAFLADLLLKTGREECWSRRLEPLFQQHTKYLDAQGWIDSLFSAENGKPSTLASLKKNNVLKVVLAGARITLCHAESCIQDMSTPEACGEQQGNPDLVENAMKLASSALSTVAKFQSPLWNVATNGSISLRCAEILHIQSRSFEILVRAATATGKISNAEFLSELLAKVKPIVSLMSGVEIPDVDKADEFEPLLAAESWPDFPLPSHWQTFSQDAISKRAYNLCVACKVSRFSGWETDEFNLDLLKKRGSQRYFGVNILGERVFGPVSLEVEEHLSSAWKRIGNRMPWARSFDFQEGLSTVKNAEWSKAANASLESGSGNVASYGEEDGIKILLVFAALCLLQAEASSSDATADALVKTALSVVLPVTQFCVGQHLWDSPLGTAAAGHTDGNAWKDFSSTEDFTGIGNTSNLGRLTARRYKQKPPGVPPCPHGAELPFVTEFVRVPASYLLKDWRQDSVAAETANGVSDGAKMAMQAVDTAVRQLRSCFTIGALQRASLHVAAAMLELVAQGQACNNPFLCLQQAVVFASQGAKGGSNDERFKKALPSEEACTPLEALVTVGRADCLQAIDFPNEAMYLCSYVARVCRLHRDRRKTDMPWTSQWRVIGICAHNVRVAIDSTVKGLSESDDGRKIVVDQWEREALEELERGKADAFARKRTLAGEGLGESTGVPRGEPPMEEDLVEDDTDARPVGSMSIAVDLNTGIDSDRLQNTDVRAASDEDSGSEAIAVVPV